MTRRLPDCLPFHQITMSRGGVFGGTISINAQKDRPAPVGPVRRSCGGDRAWHASYNSEVHIRRLSLDRIGVVVIGRNEGERLRQCLASVNDKASAAVYVDSGSTDGSIDLARALGVAAGRAEFHYNHLRKR